VQTFFGGKEMKTTLGLMSVMVTGVLGTAVYAAPLFSDTFDSGTAADAGYYRFGTTNTTLERDIVNNELDYTYASGATNRSGVIKSFANQSLAIGESLVFSFTLNRRLLNSNETHSFRVGIGNAGNPSAVTDFPVTSDLASASPMASGTRLFYQFSASTSTTAGFNQFASATSSPVHASSATAISGLTGVSSFPFSSSTALPVTLIFERTPTGMDIEKNWGGSISTGSYTTTDFDFNTLAFSMNNAGAYSFSLDNISVEVIPEPASLALGGLAVMALGRRRRA
jgi:hypothetical protein